MPFFAVSSLGALRSVLIKDLDSLIMNDYIIYTARTVVCYNDVKMKEVL